MERELICLVPRPDSRLPLTQRPDSYKERLQIVWCPFYLHSIVHVLCRYACRAVHPTSSGNSQFTNLVSPTLRHRHRQTLNSTHQRITILWRPLLIPSRIVGYKTSSPVEQHSSIGSNKDISASRLAVYLIVGSFCKLLTSHPFEHIDNQIDDPLCVVGV